MGLLEKRDYYKPFEFEFAFRAYEQQGRIHWLPSEVPLDEDVNDWNNRLSASEKQLLTQLFRFFTQADLDIAGGYIDKYLPIFKPPEIRMMLTSFAAMEAVHMHAYSLLLETVNMPEIEYQRFREFEEMAAKHDYLEKIRPGSLEDIALTLAVYSAFGEGLQLFSSFAILLNFQRFNKMKGMGQIVTWSIRDESLHVESMIKLFHAFREEHPEIWTKDFKQRIYTAARDMVDLEWRFIDLAFQGTELEGLKADDVKQYILYIADRRLIQLGLKPIYAQKDHPLDWLDWIINGVEHTNFFENRATEYSKGSLQGTWEEVYKN